jgi:hypothetical protein
VSKLSALRKKYLLNRKKINKFVGSTGLNKEFFLVVKAANTLVL